MRSIILSVMLLFAATASAIDYNKYYDIVNAKISAVKTEISVLKNSLKDNKNDVTLHKQLVRKQTELGILNEKKEKIREAEKKYAELAKQNEVLDNAKVKLLQIKQQSADMDSTVVNMF